MDRVVDDAVAAIERGDWEQLAGLLHPYLRWTDPQGRVLRGRGNVLVALLSRHPVEPPAAYELRDGQIYRWVERPTSPPSRATS